MSKTPEQIAAKMTDPNGDDTALLRDLPDRYKDEVRAAITAAIEADRAQWSDTEFKAWKAASDAITELAHERERREPQFDHEDYPDKYRDLWNENMPRVSGRMYFAIPGEQPIHVDDEEARHILAYLSEKNR